MLNNTRTKVADFRPLLCGNGVCDPGETVSSCCADCSTCGDGTCTSCEQFSCSSDCGFCGDNICQSHEVNICFDDCELECSPCIICPCDTLY